VTAVAVADWLLDAALAPAAGADDPLRPLYEATARGELALPFCAGCGQPLDLDQAICDRCGAGDKAWRTVELDGVVHSATVMHRREPGLVHARHPYPIADIELSSGHRLIVTTTRPAEHAPAIGAAVRIGFRRLGDVFIPAIDTLEDE
jgi:uncharacterized OB-fold protein